MSAEVAPRPEPEIPNARSAGSADLATDTTYTMEETTMSTTPMLWQPYTPDLPFDVPPIGECPSWCQEPAGHEWTGTFDDYGSYSIERTHTAVIPCEYALITVRAWETSDDGMEWDLFPPYIVFVAISPDDGVTPAGTWYGRESVQAVSVALQAATDLLDADIAARRAS